MKLKRLVKEISLQCDSGEAFCIVQKDGEYWELNVEDDSLISAEDLYNLVKDIFESDVTKEICNIGVVIGDDVRFTLQRDTTIEQYFYKIVAATPICELFS